MDSGDFGGDVTFALLLETTFEGCDGFGLEIGFGTSRCWDVLEEPEVSCGLSESGSGLFGFLAVRDLDVGFSGAFRLEETGTVR